MQGSASSDTLGIDGAVDIRHRDIGGRSIRVASRPATNSLPPLVVINGTRCSIEVLAPLLRALDPATGFVCFDPPGIGGSPRPWRPYLLPEISGLVNALLGDLGIPVADVLGVSWGGAPAQHFAWTHPRRCRRLVLVSTAAGPFLRPSWTVLREVVAPRRFDPVHGREVAIGLYGGKVRDDPDLLDVFSGHVTNNGGERYQMLAVAGWTSLPYLRLIRQRTFVLHGADDQLVPPCNARLLARLLPNAQLHLVPDGHLALVTSATETGPAIEAFRAAS
jgi:poly(3-hydroxyalkanoate) depolymerase